MADFHVDNVGGNSANSGASELLPKKLLSQATRATGNRVYLRRGQTHPLSTYWFFAAGMLLAAYGTGAHPVVQKDAGGDAWLYVQNASRVEMRDFAVDGNGFAGALISLAASSGAHAISNVTIRNVELYNTPNNTGLFFSGTSSGTVRKVLVEDVVVHDTYNHGAQCSTDVHGVTYERCVAYRAGEGIGAHGFTAWASSASPAPRGIEWRFCEAWGVVDFDGIEGTGIQADDNTAGCEVVGCYAHGNEGAGISLNASSGHLVTGTLCTGNGKPGIYLSNSATNCTALNNTLTGNCTRGGGFVAEIQSNGNSTGFTSKNNLLLGGGSPAKGISLSSGSASGSTSTNDLIFGFGTAVENITRSGAVAGDPLVGDDYRLGAESPAYRGGAFDARARDHFGRRLRNPPDVGAFQFAESRPTAPAYRTRREESRGAGARGQVLVPRRGR